MTQYPKENLYKVLGLHNEKDATDEEIKKAYRKKAKLYHPDPSYTLNNVKKLFPQKKNESSSDYEERMIAQRKHIWLVVSRAHEVLTDYAERRAYNLWVTENLSNSNTKTSSPKKKPDSDFNKSSGRTSGSQNGAGEKQNPQKKKTCADGSVYEGPVDSNGQPHGKGERTWYDDKRRIKLKHEGVFQHGCLNGHGKATKLIWYRDGSCDEVYEGNFSAGRFNGNGKIICYNLNRSGVSRVYEGGWRDDKKYGYGEEVHYEWSYKFDGCKRTYKGQWQNDKKHGHGVYTYMGPYGAESIKEVSEGNFHEDTFCGDGTITRYDADGNVKLIRKGFFKDGTYHWRGTETYYNADGGVKTKCSGIWKDGKRKVLSSVLNSFFVVFGTNI